MSSVISVENLGKKYTLLHQQREPYTALRDVLANGVANFAKRLLQPFHKSTTDRQIQEEFWALKNVSFEVKQGDRIGIIGRNGVGKSTLLKILSRITEPATGRVKIKGRVASLLEVGTGFHPELTGRENIYLNGAILGMTRREIASKFDEIVGFAEIEKFLDTPVKRYSSGMYVRLAFAVAAHLEPDILVIDEVLAVGDLAFQKKCLGKMGEITAHSDKTILFVSHNMDTIRSLCNRGIVLEGGSVVHTGDVSSAIDYYFNSGKHMTIKETTSVWNEQFRRGSGAVRFSDIKIFDKKGDESAVFVAGDVVKFIISYRCQEQVEGLCVCVAFRSGQMDEIVTRLFHQVTSACVFPGNSGCLQIEMPTDVFLPREYRLYFWIGNGLRQPLDVVDRLVGPIRICRDTLMELPVNDGEYFMVPSKLTFIEE